MNDLEIAIKKFSQKNFKTSLEYKYNMLQFDIGIGSIEAGKQKLGYLWLCVYSKTCSKEIHPGATHSSRAQGFSIFQSSLVSVQLPLQNSFQ